MTAPVNFYADFKGLAALKKDATVQDPQALREAARQFESLFTQMLLKSMRDAGRSLNAGESLFDNDQSDFYREMFDNQMAMQLSKGKGLGLADMLVKQLQGLAPAESSEDRKSGRAVEGERARAEEFVPLISPAKSKPLPSTPVSAELPEASSSSALPLSRASDLSTADSPVALATNTQQSLPKTRTEFIEQMWPHAEAAGRELGVDPRMLIAQAALETGWGKSVPCNPDGTCSFNLFGIKAGSSWRGASVGVNTLEFEEGVAVQRRASFRAYESPADSFRDYAALIKNSPRYAAALGAGSDATAFGSALQQGGYATDPNYANKIAAIAERLSHLKSNPVRPLAFDRRVSIGSGGET